MSDCNDTSSACMADELQAEIDRLRAASAWQPIETAPKDGESVLVWCPGKSRKGRATVAYWDVYWSLTYPGGWAEDDECEPTNWQPLPAPPEAA